MYYDYQRWYDTSIGRFISQDPLAGHLSNPQSLNPYIYVLDLPTSLTDPAGLVGGPPGARPGTCQQSNSCPTLLDIAAAWWNGLTPAQQAQVYTVGVDLAAAAAIALTVVTFGATAPIAVVAVGAAIGASASTTIYTVSQGGKATIVGAAGATVTGAVAGAVGGGAGVAAGIIGGASGTLVGMGIAGFGAVGGDVAGKYFVSSFGGEKFKVTGKSLLLDFSIGALTFGVGSKLGNVGQNYIAGSIVSRYGQPPIIAYFVGGAYSVESNGANALIGVGTEALGDFLHYLLPSQS